MMRDGFEAGPELLQKAIVLDGGLDLVTPKLLVEPGRLVDCLNYECADQVGYKKMDGFERYDGGITPSIAAGYYFLLSPDSYADLAALTAINIYPSANIQIEFGGALGSSDPRVQATITYITQATITGGTSTADLYWKIYMETAHTAEMDTGIAGITLALPDVVMYDEAYTVFWSVEKISGLARVAEEAVLATALTSADTTRATIDALPGDVFPYGLQMYDSRMHAVANCQYLYLVYDHTQSVPVTSAAQFFPGNVFRNGASGREGIILDYKFLYGSFGSLCTGATKLTSAVVKVLVRYTNTAALTDSTVLNIDRANPTYTTASVAYWKYISALTGTAATDSQEVWGGVLYRGLVDGATRTSNNDWEQIDMGFEVGFSSGNSSIVPRELTLATTTAQLNSELQTTVGYPSTTAGTYSQITMLAYRNSATSVPVMPTAGWDAVDGLGAIDGSTFTFDLSTANSTGVYLTKSAAGSGPWGDGLAVTFKNLGISIPTDVIITGITVSSRNFYNSAAASNPVYFHTVTLTTPTGTVSENKANVNDTLTTAANGTSANAKTYTYGGANIKWGLSELTPEVVNSADFMLTMTPANTTLATAALLFWDKLTVTVHYFRPVGKLFFYNTGASSPSELEMKLVRIHLAKGSWSAGDAEGTMHVYSPVDNNARNYVTAGDAIRLISGGSSIGTASSVRASFLPSHAELVAGNSRFQMLNANYYLNPEWDTIYGCHGLGRAFSYDGIFFRKIYSAYDSQLDKPRHIASYRNYLALGYLSGNVLLSKYGESGPEPENFDPLQGAREFSFADKITGLSPLADTSLAVCCQSSINRIVLNSNAASASNLFYTAVVSSDSGAIEYTVATFGNMTLYCDQYGIRAVEQTDMQGAFIGRPLSNMVSPWLRPRLSAKKYWLDSRTAQVPLFAHSIRAKNQYRVWFTDGYVLCMNMNSAEEAPRFTFLRYGFNSGGAFVPLLPIAYTSCVDTTGTERIHVAHWNRATTASTGENYPTLFKYVFEMEKGWSFDGQDFPARLTMNLSFLETPFDYDQIRKVELHAADYNNTTLFAGFGTKYGEEGSYTGMTLGSTFVPGGRNTAGAIALDYTPFAKMINVASRGRPLYLKFKNSSTATGDTSASAIEPPHILQALLVQYTPARQET